MISLSIVPYAVLQHQEISRGCRDKVSALPPRQSTIWKMTELLLVATRCWLVAYQDVAGNRRGLAVNRLRLASARRRLGDNRRLRSTGKKTHPVPQMQALSTSIGTIRHGITFIVEEQPQATMGTQPAACR